MCEKPEKTRFISDHDDDLVFWRMDGYDDDWAPYQVVPSEHILGIPFWCVGSLYEAAWSALNANQDNSKTVSQASRALLFINGDNYTAWNYRRELLSYSSVDAELDLCAVVLSRHPKSDEAWAYRRWLFHQANHVNIVNELKLCDRMSEKHPRNYYAWSYRCEICSVD